MDWFQLTKGCRATTRKKCTFTVKSPGVCGLHMIDLEM